MAVSLHKRWYEKSSNTTKRNSNYVFDTCSTKRKGHSFDTGTAPTVSAPPGYKIPRKGQLPVTPQAKAVGLPTPAAPTFRVDDEIEVALLPTPEELSKSLSSSMSFAEAASSTTTGAKTKVNYEFILFVSTGGEERLGVSKPTWNLFTEKLTDLVMSRIFGVGVLTVVDADSQALTKQLVGDIEMSEHKFRAWAKNHRGKNTSVTAKLPAMLKSQPYGKIMAALTKLNGLPA